MGWFTNHSSSRLKLYLTRTYTVFEPYETKEIFDSDDPHALKDDAVSLGLYPATEEEMAEASDTIITDYDYDELEDIIVEPERSRYPKRE